MNKNDIEAHAKNASLIDKDNFIIALCKNKTVLDVGCVGQDRNYASPDWLHNKVRKVSASLDGVDVFEDKILQLRAQGYSIFSATEIDQSRNQYEVILMSDVIEHVNDPVAFLQFYTKFLSQTGRLFVSTPNANRSNNVINILFNNNYTVNPEHVFWFCPKTMAEVVDRAGLEVESFFWADHYYRSRHLRTVYAKFKFMLVNLLKNLRSNFSPNMIFIIKTK